jgi:hypothetical protein
VETCPVDLVSTAEREEFLPAGHVDVLSAAVGTAGGTLAVSAWYSCQPSSPPSVPPVTQGRSEGPTLGIMSGILIGRGDPSPRQNTLFGAA